LTVPASINSPETLTPSTSAMVMAGVRLRQKISISKADHDGVGIGDIDEPEYLYWPGVRMRSWRMQPALICARVLDGWR